jgi:hypothetical protein
MQDVRLMAHTMHVDTNLSNYQLPFAVYKPMAIHTSQTEPVAYRHRLPVSVTVCWQFVRSSPSWLFSSQLSLLSPVAPLSLTPCCGLHPLYYLCRRGGSLGEAEGEPLLVAATHAALGIWDPLHARLVRDYIVTSKLFYCTND